MIEKLLIKALFCTYSHQEYCNDSQKPSNDSPEPGILPSLGFFWKSLLMNLMQMKKIILSDSIKDS